MDQGVDPRRVDNGKPLEVDDETTCALVVDEIGCSEVFGAVASSGYEAGEVAYAWGRGRLGHAIRPAPVAQRIERLPSKPNGLSGVLTCTYAAQRRAKSP